MLPHLDTEVTLENVNATNDYMEALRPFTGTFSKPHTWNLCRN